uniref:Uncharacterized protein n=1 Tax=viral metagenome TaxID=1070528 RepID=A0A6C0BF68_9ZZZZ
MLPWNHPCFVGIHVSIHFKDGNKIIKSRYGDINGREGDIIEQIDVYLYDTSVLKHRLTERNVCDILSDYTGTTGITEDIVQIYYMKSVKNIYRIDDRGSEHDFMI